MKYPIVPALIPEDRAAVLDFSKVVSFAQEIQIDVVDGQFVPMKSWPYEPSGEPKTIAHATDPFTLEVDLMVKDPVAAAHEWIAAGADMLVFHIESVSLEAFKFFAERCPVSVGVACHGVTSLKTLFEYAAFADYVQLMGITTIGQQGEPFDADVLNKIKVVKTQFPDMLVSIDGSVNETTVAKLRQAGADRFVSGSAIVGSENPEAAFKKLQSLVN